MGGRKKGRQKRGHHGNGHVRSVYWTLTMLWLALH